MISQSGSILGLVLKKFLYTCHNLPQMKGKKVRKKKKKKLSIRSGREKIILFAMIVFSFILLTSSSYDSSPLQLENQGFSHFLDSIIGGGTSASVLGEEPTLQSPFNYSFIGFVIIAFLLLFAAFIYFNKNNSR